MDSYFLNFEPIIQPILTTLVILGFLAVIVIIVFLVHNYFGLNLVTKHDDNLVKQFLEKYPLVNPDFYKKTRYEQIVENNQELHEKTLADAKRDAEFKQLSEYTHNELKEMKSNIAGIVKMLEEMKEHGQIR